MALNKPRTNILNKGQDVSSLAQSGDFGANNIKMYANYVKVGGPHQSIFEENAHTLVYIEKIIAFDAYVIDFNELPVIEVHDNRIDGSKMHLESKTKMKIFTTEHLSSLFNKQIIIFTENKPLDPQAYLQGKQFMFISQNTIPTEVNQLLNDETFSEELQQRIKTLEDIDNLTYYDLVDINEINNITNSVLWPTLQTPLTKLDNIQFEYDHSFAMQHIYGKGTYPNQSLTNIDFIIAQDDFMVSKLTPLKTENRLEVLNYNMNRDNVLPYEYLSQFSNKFKGLRSEIIEGNSKYTLDLWQLLCSLLELTKAFANSFSEYQITGNDGRSGIDPNATIGGRKIGLLSGVASQDATSAISGRIVEWENSHPSHIGSHAHKKFKIFVRMLSKYVQCDLAVSGGLNSNHVINDVFYFELGTAIYKGMANTATNEILVALKSNFYDFVNNNLVIKPQLKNLSNYQVFNTLDGDLSLAELPMQVLAVDVPAKAGDIALQNDNASKYYIYTKVKNPDTLSNAFGVLDKYIPSKIIEHRTLEHIDHIPILIHNNSSAPDMQFINDENIFQEIMGWLPTKAFLVKHGYANAYDFYFSNLSSLLGWLIRESPAFANLFLPKLLPNEKYSVGANNIQFSKVQNMSINDKIGSTESIGDGLFRYVKGKLHDSAIYEGTTGGKVPYLYYKFAYTGFYKNDEDNQPLVYKYNENINIKGKDQKLWYFIMKIKITINYSVEVPSKIANLFAPQTTKVLNKYSYTKLAQSYDINDKVRFTTDLSGVEQLHQISLVGLWGNSFSLKIQDKNHNILTLNNLEFTSKFNEINTITKINL